jgi:hypothetical protein
MAKQRVIRKVLIGMGVAVGALGIVIATRPSTFHVERSITIAAPAESAFAQVNDFHAWATWSPYEKLDPQMTRTFEGPRSGTGAIYSWSSKGKAGEGRMTIAKSELPSQVAIKLEFLKPFECTNTAAFTFTPAPEGTKVTWAMDAENTFLGKAASLVLDMDKLVGSDFERGLVDLKTVAESASRANVAATNAVP